MGNLLFIALMAQAIQPPAQFDVPVADSAAYAIDPVTVAVSLKRGADYRTQPVAATSLDLAHGGGVPPAEPKELSLVVPGMLHADYGARMTGSIYLRGLGSRMEHPAVGLYVDGVPVMNKNNYDFDYFDLRRIDVLRGPQGTLYGRNTIGGVVDVQTLSPFDFQGVRLGAGYGTANSWSARAAIYRRPTARLGYSFAASHRATDGYFTNDFDGSRADAGRSTSARAKLLWRLSERWTLENSLHAGLVRQKGFAYAPYDEATGAVGAINHNDPCGYDRANLMEGLTFRYTGEAFHLTSTTGYQFLSDRMTLDQDFSPQSLFTLTQSQREHAVTHEVVARSAGAGRWQWLAGAFGFWRGVEMDAPVDFKRDGIDQLILANANRGIHTVFPDADLEIRQRSFTIGSDFTLPSWGASLFHQSTWDVGRWSLTAGLRADVEHTAIRYRNAASVDYRFTLTMPDYKTLPVGMSGHRARTFFEVMPRVAAMFSLGGTGNLYASVTRGYKAGGYNTQIFSDIVQNRMMTDMMADMGIYFDGAQSYDVEEAIAYDPERSWSHEVGGHLNLADGRLAIDAALFWIECRNQQLTVFPPGTGTGRLMSNAGRTRSLGAEVSAVWSVGDFTLTGGWGHTDARFVEYHDGREDYAGKRVPYAPQNTVSLQGEYGVDLRGGRSGRLTFGLGVQGAGRIWWNEANTLSQPVYLTANASAGWERGRVGLSLWARNLTGTSYDTFYFRSVGRSFVQRAKPAQAGVELSLTL